MKHYKVFVKDILNINLPAKACMDVLNGSILRVDLLGKPTSSIKVVQIASNINIGDIAIVFDNYGQHVYTGIVSSYSNNVITCTYITSIFKDIVPTNIFDTSISVENMFSKSFNDFYNDPNQLFHDSRLKRIFDKIICNKMSETNNLMIFEKNSSISLEQVLIDIFKNYRIVSKWSIDQLSESLSLSLEKKYLSNIIIADNSAYTLQFDVETQSQENTRIIVFGEDALYRGSFYTSLNGITSDSSDLLRPSYNKSLIVYSNDELDKIVNENLSNTIHQHQIKITLLSKKNNLFDTRKIIEDLGCEFEIWKSQKMYHSILTAYDIEIDSSKTDSIKLVFGLVRNRLEFIL